MIYYKISYNFLLKIIAFKKGSLTLSSTFLSTGVIYYLSLLFKGIEIKDMILTVLVESIFLLLFLVFTSIDFITGIQASFYLNMKRSKPLPARQVIKSSKLWRTFWKSFGVIMLTLMLTFLSLISSLMQGVYIHWLFMWSLIGFWIMACGFEFYSIGENLAKRNHGSKPRIFGFVDKILDAIQRRAINNIDGVLKDIQDKK